MNLVPLFPLQLVLFPQEILPLHIFEPRYKQMVQHCIKTETPFGIVSFIDKNVSRVGCLCAIESVRKTYDDGKLDIVCRGGDRFLTHSFNSTKPYLQGNITTFHDDETAEPVDAALLETVQNKYQNLIAVASKSWDETPTQLPMNSYEFGHLVGFDLAQKQNLIEIKSEADRLRFIIDHIDRILPQMQAFDEVHERIKRNGHFREFPPLDFNLNK
jgi:Lon protease-like protein